MRLQFALSVLPLLAVGQKTAQQSFKDLCPTDAKTSGITKLNGEQYNYYCNERWETYQKPSTKYDDPDACATYVSSQSGPTVMWMKNGACTVGSSTSRKDNTGVVCFEKVASSGGSTCCQERDDYKKQLSACQTLRDQYKQERDTCKSSASSGSGPSTGGTGSSRVFDCKGVTGVAGQSAVNQSGYSWSVTCNMSAGVGAPIKRPADTVVDLPQCVDICSKVPSCKVATLLPQTRGNCVMYTANGNFNPSPNAHFAVRS